METVLIIGALAGIWKALQVRGDELERARDPEAYDRGVRDCNKPGFETESFIPTYDDRQT
jgi:hypothetical protein